MNYMEGCSCFPMIRARGRQPHGDAEYMRRSMANALTVILLQAEVIRRHGASRGTEDPALESAEQIELGAKRIWTLVNGWAFEPMG